MNDAADDGRAALKILRSHYKGSGKPRVLTLYTNLCNLQMGTKSLTEYVSKTERLSTNLKSCNETVSNSMPIAMVMRGLPESYSSFIVVITQSSKEYTFLEFKAAIHNFNENMKSRNDVSLDRKDNVMQSKEHYKKEIKCFGCKKIGHYARNCPTLFCKLCNIKGHTSENCRSRKKTVMTPASNHDRAKALGEDSEHECAFRISDNRLNSGPCKKGRGDLLVDSGATTHIINNCARF